MVPVTGSEGDTAMAGAACRWRDTMQLGVADVLSVLVKAAQVLRKEGGRGGQVELPSVYTKHTVSSGNLR